MELHSKQSQMKRRQLHKRKVEKPFVLRRHARCSILGAADLRQMSTCPPSMTATCMRRLALLSTKR